MKTVLVRILGLGLLLLGQPRLLSAQQPQPQTAPLPCHDLLILRDGSRFRGQLESINPDETYTYRLWTGLVLTVQQKQVKRVVQKCNERKLANGGVRPYTFREHGFYHFTRAGALIGQVYSGANSVGYNLQHSSGYLFARQLGVGIGAGIEFFDPSGNDVATYPVFAEVRSFLQPQRLSPFVAIGGGWAFTGNKSGNRWSYDDAWRGGWMAQAEIGYRIGNHFTVNLGLRLQRKYRDWTSVWGPDNGQGADRILNKRLSMGLGLLL